MRFVLVSRSVLLATSLSLLSAASQAATSQPLTQCGQDVHGNYYLTGDLDCGGSGIGVNLHGMSRLELRGFSIRNAGDYAIQCFQRCEIVGPGSLVDNFGGVWAPKRVGLSDVTIQNNAGMGVGVGGGTVTIRSSVIQNNEVGVMAGRRLRLENSTVSGNRRSGLVSGFTPSHEESCVGGRVALDNSSVEGNSVDPDPDYCTDTEGCADIASCSIPRLTGTSSCGTSLHYESMETWSVCSQD